MLQLGKLLQGQAAHNLKIGFSALLVVNCLNAYAQSGVVKEAGTNDVLPFTTLQWQKAKKISVADLDGKFLLPKTDDPQDTLIVSLPGYETRKFSGKIIPIIIELVPRNYELSAVEIRPGENPAHRIIRNVIAARANNNPDNLAAYQYDSYNKVKFVPLGKIADSTFKDSDLIMWESVTQRSYVRPNKSKEELIGSKISGLPGQALPFSPTDIQDLSFYTDWVKVFGEPVLSPIAKNALKHYRYTLMDTAYDDNDTIFTVQFEALNPASGFKGKMQVHTGGYALQSLQATAHLPESAIIFKDAQIRQIHQRVNGKWFPAQLDADITLESNSTKTDEPMLALAVRSYLKNIRLESETQLNETKFNAISLEIAPKAAEQNESFWGKYRNDSLTTRERNTYRLIDSLAKKNPFMAVVGQTEKLLEGKIGVGPIDIDLRRIYDYNRVEKHRLGLGLYTNDKITTAGQVGGWFGYGFGDKAWKYGGSLRLTPFKTEQVQAYFAYEKNLLPTGGDYLGILARRPLYRRDLASLNIRNFFLEILDYTEQYSATLYFPSHTTIQHALSLVHQKVTPAYLYSYQDVNQFNFTEVQFQTRWAPGERFIRKGKKFFTNNLVRTPIFEFKYVKGLDNLFAGEYNYQQVSIALSQAANLNAWGKLRYYVSSGVYSGALPYPKLYVFNGNDRDYIAQLFSFNTMGYNEFAANQFGTAHLYWTPRNTRFPSPNYSPDLTLSLSAAWGKGANFDTLNHKHLPLQAPEKGFYELGMSLTNIFPRPMVRFISTLRFFGVGVYYRVGAYAAPRWQDNLFPKIEFLINLN